MADANYDDIVLVMAEMQPSHLGIAETRCKGPRCLKMKSTRQHPPPSIFALSFSCCAILIPDSPSPTIPFPAATSRGEGATRTRARKAEGKVLLEADEQEEIFSNFNAAVYVFRPLRECCFRCCSIRTNPR